MSLSRHAISLARPFLSRSSKGRAIPKRNASLRRSGAGWRIGYQRLNRISYSTLPASPLILRRYWQSSHRRALIRVAPD